MHLWEGNVETGIGGLRGRELLHSSQGNAKSWRRTWEFPSEHQPQREHGKSYQANFKDSTVFL